MHTNNLCASGHTDGTTATFNIVLNTQPTADVTIDISSDDTSEGTISPATVTFTTGNWDTAQTTTITGVDDSEADGDVAYNIVLDAAVSTDPNYNGIDPDDVAVVNEDNDSPGISVSAISGNTKESSRPGCQTPASHRTVRDSLLSYGSCQFSVYLGLNPYCQ